MKRIYIAGNYNAPDIIGCLDNMRRGIQMAVGVLKAGFAPFCPWLDYHYRLMDAGVTREMYQAQSIAWLETADAVLVLSDSEESQRTQVEITKAKELGIPVYHSLKQLIEAIVPEEHICKHCGGDIRIRNPKGFCDHLFYPESCNICKRTAQGRR